MGKMKELYMQIHYPEDDLEREYLINDYLSKEQEYLQYLALQEDPEINLDQTKIEVQYGEQTRIEVNNERIQDYGDIESQQIGFQ